jgi:SAM-dependent methyltransferase
MGQFTVWKLVGEKDSTLRNRAEKEKALADRVEWGERAQKGFLSSGIDPADRSGHKNFYIDLLQKKVLEEVLELRGDETVLDFGCGSGRIAYWIAPKVKKVIGLEVTPEMIELAENNRTASNVEFILYDGSHFPDLPCLFDLILSVGVLQIMKGEWLKRTLYHLGEYLEKGGRVYLIEQVSDNPKVDRPCLKEYLEAFASSKLECLQYHPIRNGRWCMLYLIRYGMIPKGWFGQMAHYELEKRRREKGLVRYYKDFLFVLRKGR